eukprot:2670956-Amphidinium_carterae.1
MGQAAIESQYIKQEIEEMVIPEMDTDNVTMKINTDSSAEKAVASWLGLNRKSKHASEVGRFAATLAKSRCAESVPSEVLLVTLPTTRLGYPTKPVA